MKKMIGTIKAGQRVLTQVAKTNANKIHTDKTSAAASALKTGKYDLPKLTTKALLQLLLIPFTSFSFYTFLF